MYSQKNNFHSIPILFPFLCIHMYIQIYILYTYTFISYQGRNLGEGGAGGARPLLNFVLWLLIDEQHFLHYDKGHVLPQPSYCKYTCAPLSKLPICALTTHYWYCYFVSLIFHHFQLRNGQTCLTVAREGMSPGTTCLAPPSPASAT